MAKSITTVTHKMKSGMQNAGAAIKDGFSAENDPMKVIAQNVEGYGQAMAAGVAKAVSDGTYAKGVQQAASNGTWSKSAEKAARNYAAQANVAVEEYMKQYPARMQVIEAAVKQYPAVPGESRDARIARGGQIQKAIGEGMDRLYGRS